MSAPTANSVSVELRGGDGTAERVSAWFAAQPGWTLEAATTTRLHLRLLDDEANWYRQAGTVLAYEAHHGFGYVSLRALAPLNDETSRLAPLAQRVEGWEPQRRSKLPRGVVRHAVLCAGGPTTVVLHGFVNVTRQTVTARHVASGRSARIYLDRATARHANGVEAGGGRGLKAVWIAFDGPRLADLWRLEQGVRAAFGKRLAKVGIWARLRGMLDASEETLDYPLVLPGDRLADTAARILGREFAVLQRELPATRLGVDPEGLHAMRVACRRLRTAIRIFGGTLPLAAREVGEELRWLAALLGTVRDLDVHLMNLPAYAEALAATEAAIFLDYRDELWRQREQARRDMLAGLGDPRFEALLASLSGLLALGTDALAATALDPTLAATETAEAAPALLAKQLKAVRKRGKAALDAAGEGEALHAVRIACKRLRYSAEWLLPLYDDRLREFLRRVVKLQTLIGEHQDATVAMATLRLAASDYPVAPGTGTASPGAGAASTGAAERLLCFGELIAAKRRVLEDVEARFPEQWRRFVASIPPGKAWKAHKLRS